MMDGKAPCGPYGRTGSIRATKTELATLTRYIQRYSPYDVNAGCFELSYAFICILGFALLGRHAHAEAHSVLLRLPEQVLDAGVMGIPLLHRMAF